MEQPKSNWTGSQTTYKMVAEQIRERWGNEEVKNYRPEFNCLPFKGWVASGFRIKKGSKALKSITYVSVKNESGEVVKTYPKSISLFYYLDAEKIRDREKVEA